MTRDTDILKLIHGELDSSDSARVQQEIADTPEVKRLYDQYNFIYSSRNQINAIRGIDTVRDWSILNSRLGRNTASTVTSAWLWMALAAVLLGAIAVGMYFYLKPAPYITERADLAQQTIALPDGSTALLEPGAQITYHRYMMDDETRSVELIGDAEFDVTNDPDHPFVVESDGAAIRVLGTVFTITGDNDASVIENKEGLIKCEDILDESINVTLEEGDKAIWDGSTFEHIPAFVPPPPPPPGEDVRIDDFIDIITDKYPSIVEFSPYMPYDDRTVFVEMNQSLEGIISQLDTSSTLEFKKLGRRYRIDYIGPKK